MSTNKLEGIQMLRGYAAILVVVTHLWNTGAIAGMLRFSKIGGFGVDIFFVISGFIMCYSLRDQIYPRDGMHFLRKRVERVYPTYLIILVPFLIEYFYSANGSKGSTDPMFALGNTLLLPSFFGGENYRMLVGPAWTLTYELFFYTLFAGAIVLCRSKKYAINAVIIAIIFMVTLVNFLGLKGPRLQWSNFQYMVGDTLLLNFVIGCICYLVWHRYARRLFGFWAAIFCLLGLTIVSLLLAKAGLPRIVSLGLPAGLTVLVFLFSEFEVRSLTRPLLFLGSASYSIYLVHAVVAHWKSVFVPGTAGEGDLNGFLLTAGAVSAGCIFYVTVEARISRLLNKPSGVLAPSARPAG